MSTSNGTATIEQVPKVVHQLRRAQALADVVRTIYKQPGWAFNATQYMDWGLAAACAGLSAPSEDMVALAVELLRQEAEQ